ncbi:unnamed protein product [Linum trigynum]
MREKGEVEISKVRFSEGVRRKNGISIMRKGQRIKITKARAIRPLITLFAYSDLEYGVTTIPLLVSVLGRGGARCRLRRGGRGGCRRR